MHRLYLVLWALLVAAPGLAEEISAAKFSSPNGRFALRINEPSAKEEAAGCKVELIERSSGEVKVDLGIAERRYLSGIVLKWSADSKRVAYSVRESKGGVMSVHFWNGSAFAEVDLPDDLPDPRIRFRKRPGADATTYPATLTPVRWLRSGALEITCELTVLSQTENVNYTGVMPITLVFDARNKARLLKTGKTRTTTDE